MSPVLRPYEEEAPPERLVTLIGKPGCHLCDDAQAVVEKVCAETRRVLGGEGHHPGRGAAPGVLGADPGRPGRRRAAHLLAGGRRSGCARPRTGRTDWSWPDRAVHGCRKSLRIDGRVRSRGRDREESVRFCPRRVSTERVRVCAVPDRVRRVCVTPVTLAGQIGHHLCARVHKDIACIRRGGPRDVWPPAAPLYPAGAPWQLAELTDRRPVAEEFPRPPSPGFRCTCAR